MTHRHPNPVELKAKYKGDYEKAQSFINEFDPCGFIHFGTPDLTIMLEPEKTQFYQDIDILLDKLSSIKPSH